MKFTKVYKVLDTIFSVFTYIPALLVFASIVMNLECKDLANGADYAPIYDGLMTAGIITFIVLMVLLFPMYILSIVAGFTTKESLTKHTMITKLALIPFYVINFVAAVWLLTDGYTLSWFLLPVFAVLLIVTTYLIMLRTSLPVLIMFIKFYIKKKIKVTPWGIISLVCLFLFCIDVVAAILLYAIEKRNLPEVASVRKQKKDAIKLAKIEKWKSKKGMSLKAFKVSSIVASSLSYAALTVYLVQCIIGLVFLIQSDDRCADILSSPLSIICVICVGIAVLFKLIIGLIYGKKGKEDPTKFAITMKYVDLPLFLGLVACGAISFAISTFFGIVAVALLPVIAVVIVALAVVGFAFGFGATFALGVSSMASGYIVALSDSLVVFNYYLNQRTMNNTKFLKKITILYLVMLWIPILDIPAMYLLKNLADKGQLFSDQPVIKEAPAQIEMK